MTNNYYQGLITSKEYSDTRAQQDLNRYLNIWLISIFSTITKLGVYCVSIFMIIRLFSIVLDESFNRKMRRIALGLVGKFYCSCCIQ